MNLSTEAWIPVVWGDGRPGLVSLREAFQRGEKIGDLAVRPHERVALMRLLICIAQTALDGPTDYDDWNACGARIVPSALGYLKKWEHAFELFGDGPRFLQVTNLKKPSKKEADDDEGNSAGKLDLALATGNNPTLFDNSGGSERPFPREQLALNLLTFQCFSPGGLIAVVLWDGVETSGKGSSDHAPCLAGGMLHAVVRGIHLLETLRLNLLPKDRVALLLGKERWGQPLWELPPTRPSDARSVANATGTYLGRLVPLSRAIRLEADCRTMLLGNGLRFGAYPEWREPMATIVVRSVKGLPERVVLRASLDKAPWRELHSLTVRNVSQSSNGGPAALQNLPEEDPFDLWVGGLVADKAKLLDVAESVVHVPAAMLHEPNQRAYEKGIAFAETAEHRLRRAISVYHKALGDDLDRRETRERRQRVQSTAAVRFWTDAESRVGELLGVAERPQLLGLDNDWTGTGWGKIIRAATVNAYDAACSHGTARQMLAYTLGRRVLSGAPEYESDEKEAEL